MSANAIISTFDTTLEGWVPSGDVQSYTWLGTGGNPNGYAYWVDLANGQETYWVAPAQFLGNDSRFYGGTLSYDVIDTGNNDTGEPDVILTGGGLTIEVQVGQSGTSWTHLSVALDTTAPWHINTLGGALATSAQIQTVLGSLTSMQIRAEYVNGPESGGLDNVAMTVTGAGSVAWNLFTSPTSPTYLGGFNTFAQALASASAGNEIDLANLTGLKQKANASINVENLTVHADTTLKGAFALADGILNFTLSGSNKAAVTGNASNNVITGSDGNNSLAGGAGNDTLFGGGGKDILNGGAGQDFMDGGAAADTFFYGAASESAGTLFDTVAHFKPTQDVFSLPFAVTGVDATITTGTLSNATFSTDLSAWVDSGHLAAHHAVVFTPNAGNYSGHKFLIIDADGTAGYQSGDMVIELNKPTSTTLTTGDFIGH